MRTVKRGYVPLPGRVDKYPFHLLGKPGDYLDPPYPWEARHRVRSAVRTWNRKHPQQKLHVNLHSKTHVVVGWP